MLVVVSHTHASSRRPRRWGRKREQWSEFVLCIVARRCLASAVTVALAKLVHSATSAMTHALVQVGASHGMALAWPPVACLYCTPAACLWQTVEFPPVYACNPSLKRHRYCHAHNVRAFHWRSHLLPVWPCFISSNNLNGAKFLHAFRSRGSLRLMGFSSHLQFWNC